MRVAIDVSAIPADPAGAGVYVLRVVEALAASGQVELALVARRDDGERWRGMAPRAEVRAVVPAARPLRLAWEQLRAPALARSLGVDVWHGPHYTMPLRSPVPTVVTIHDLTFIEHPEWHEGSKARFFPPMIRAAARRAGALVCVSEHTARRLVALAPPRGPVVVATHGVDHARFRPDGGNDDDDATLAALGVRPPFVAFVGTIEPRKDVPALVRAAARLDPEVQLVLAGRSGWGADAVDAAIAETGMAARTVRLGFVDDTAVVALFRRAAAVAYPSLEEGFGLPALEALACGAALVTTRGSAMEDVVEDAAELIAPGDVGALADALSRLVAGGPEVERLRARGPQVAAPHTWARSAERHLEAYRLASES